MADQFAQIMTVNHVNWLLRHLADELAKVTPKFSEADPAEARKAWTVPAGHLKRLKASLGRLSDSLVGGPIRLHARRRRPTKTGHLMYTQGQGTMTQHHPASRPA